MRKGSRFDPHITKTYDLCINRGFQRHLPDDFKHAVVDWFRNLIDEDDARNRGDPADW